MPSLRELITGRDPEKEAKVRAGAQAFAAEHDPEDHAPQEEGLKDSSFIPDTSEDLAAKGWKMGTIPFGPGGVGAVAEAEKGESMVQKLLAKGVPQEKLDAAAEAMRMNGSHTFTDELGKPVMTVGKNSQLGQELDAMGRSNVERAAADSPSINYGETAQTDAGGVGRMNKVRPVTSEKTGLQSIRELQARGRK